MRDKKGDALPSSRLAGFYKKSLQERLDLLDEWVTETSTTTRYLLTTEAGLPLDRAENMIENVIGRYSLPLGLATNFQINQRDYLIPMVVEEPSVVAACSFAAKLVRAGGGFLTISDDPVMIGQIQLLDLDDLTLAEAQILQHKDELLSELNNPDSTIIRLGGGVKDLQIRHFPQTAIGKMLVVHLLYDVRDAMGANVINTACEKLAPHLERITGGRVNLRILSNYSDQRKATAHAMIPAESLATQNADGRQVVERIVEAGVFAELDPYRAVTHNKGIMNGIDAVVIATGNDWRAVEAAAHAYASRNGHYASMTRWWQDDDGSLRGELTLPMAVGIVGGATKVHPVAKLAVDILGVQSAQELSEVLVAVGLAQNLAAIRALATDGIQRGHMSLHARQIALAAGAPPELVNHIAQQLVTDGNIRVDHAKNLIAQHLSDESNR